MEALAGCEQGPSASPSRSSEQGSVRTFDYIVDDVPSFLNSVVAHIPAGSIVELGGRLEPSMHPYELARTSPFSNHRYAITEECRAVCAVVLSGLARARNDVISLDVHAPTGTYFEAPHFFDGADAPVIFIHDAFPLDLLDKIGRASCRERV